MIFKTELQKAYKKYRRMTTLYNEEETKRLLKVDDLKPLIRNGFVYCQTLKGHQNFLLEDIHTMKKNLNNQQYN